MPGDAHAEGNLLAAREDMAALNTFEIATGAVVVYGEIAAAMRTRFKEHHERASWSRLEWLNLE